jgi:16S rRNA (cytidine1402-2'-O)-methyltransferase
MPGKLYLVGTPIGNLGDMTPRAREALAAADFIAAEDTRVSLKLLNHFAIKKPLVSYYEHNKYASGEKILERILNGETCALVTDAGMPAVSDPGADMVELCVNNGVDVFVVPGPCAAVSALAVSGLPTGRFTFEGFLSTTRKTRAAHLESLKNEPRTMIFYEAPHKLLKTLADLLDALGTAPFPFPASSQSSMRKPFGRHCLQPSIISRRNRRGANSSSWSPVPPKLPPRRSLSRMRSIWS